MPANNYLTFMNETYSKWNKHFYSIYILLRAKLKVIHIKTFLKKTHNNKKELQSVV